MYANFLKYLLMKFINWERKGNFKLCLSILTCKNIKRVNKPSYHTTRLNTFKYNEDDSKFEVYDIKPVSSTT